MRRRPGSRRPGSAPSIALARRISITAGMRSMTGYGRATAAIGKQTLTVQASSVNRRTLDLTVSLPPEWEGIEPEIVERVRRVVLRGKVHVSIELPAAPGEGEAAWDDADVRATLDRLSRPVTPPCI